MDKDELIDANKVIDMVKLKFYNEYLYTQHMYDEEEAAWHQMLTEQVVAQYIDPLDLPKDAQIADLGCGPGFFLDEMKKREYQNVVGVTLSPKDYKSNTEKGHNIKRYDFTWLPQTDGFEDEKFDLVFIRHTLEHSPYPIFTLMEINRILKQNGKVYVETPAPLNDRPHEFNLNHYSIFDCQMLIALMLRTGFEITVVNNLEFDLNDTRPDMESKTYKEKYYCILAKKVKPLDVK